MTFEALANLIQRNHQEDYYELLLMHSGVILTEIGRTNKSRVAESLNISIPVFSTVYKLIVAYHNIKTREAHNA